MTDLQSLCRQAADSLCRLGWRVVFAESCTAGLVSAALGSIPGISEYLCGSAVTYRDRTKQDWLGVSKELLVDPGPVSKEVVTAMARGALDLAVEADLALAITGHLGPAAPPALDGVVHLGVACKNLSRNDDLEVRTTSRMYQLESRERALRQHEAAQQLVITLLDTMEIFEAWKKISEGSLKKCRFHWHQHDLSRQPDTRDEESVSPDFLFPGSFNPRHDGHQQITEFVKRSYGARVEYELSILNVDKPVLEISETLSRLLQFVPQDPVWLTGSSTFEEKAKLFPKTTFVVGADTIMRVGDLRYYQSPAAQRQAIQTITESGCRFLVFGRWLDSEVPRAGVGEPGFCQLEDLDLNEDLRQLCTEVPESAFRCDISSTQIRATRLDP